MKARFRWWFEWREKEKEVKSKYIHIRIKEKAHQVIVVLTQANEDETSEMKSWKSGKRSF